MDIKEINRVKRYASKHPDMKSEWYLCLVEEDPEFKTPWGIGREEMWGVYSEGMNGYKWAKEKYPYKINRKRRDANV